MRFFTIGVYNSSEDDFFNKLIANRVDTFCDIRQRRGVRGARYSFVNSARLQKKLDERGIKYYHIKGLAPAVQVREIQNKADQQQHILKREREALDPGFIFEYQKKVLDNFDFESFIKSLEAANSKSIVFFCVEEGAQACHRGIVANKLNQEYNFEVTNL